MPSGHGHQPKRESAEARFARMHTVDKATGCWNWTGTMRGNGYGRLKVGSRYTGDRRDEEAHRFSYEMHKGRIPDGLQLDHLCRNTLCVNPDHLEAVTARVNTLRSENPAAKNARKTRCPKGHELAGDNLYVSRDGQRGCRTCRSATRRAHYLKTNNGRPRHA